VTHLLSPPLIKTALPFNFPHPGCRGAFSGAGCIGFSLPGW
jgi:hypothetical protein